MRTIPSYSLATHLHFHEAIECIYMIEGSVIASIDGREERLLPGDLALFRSRGVHTMVTEGEKHNSYYVLKVDPALLRSISPATLAGKFPFRFSVFNPALKSFWKRQELEGGVILSYINKLVENYNNPRTTSDVAMIIAALGIFEEMFAESEREFNSLSLYSDVIYHAIVYVNEHFDEDIKEEDVAAKFGLSYSYFSRSFKAATGRTFRDYLICARVNEADQLITNSDLSIAEVARKCGYANVSHFIGVYKKQTGKTPLQARKESRHNIISQ